jgi:hypothetical protein
MPTTGRFEQSAHSSFDWSRNSLSSQEDIIVREKKVFFLLKKRSGKKKTNRNQVNIEV